MFEIKQAVRSRAKLRLAIDGPPGSGKTWTSIAIGTTLGKTIVLDTERGSASLYGDDFKFDVLEIPDFSPMTFMNAIRYAEQQGYEVIIVDSMSHAWAGTGGVLDQVDKAGKLQGGGNFAGWKAGTKMQNDLVETILTSTCHVICTMRSKVEHVVDKDERGKSVVRKLGLKPIQRDEIEHEFTIYGSMNQQHELIIHKSRCSVVADAVVSKPGRDFAYTLLEWLDSGKAVKAKPPTPPVEAEVEPPPGARWFAQLVKHADALHIPDKYVQTYLKKKNAPTVAKLTEEIFTRAVLDLDVIATGLAAALGDAYSAEAVTEDLLKQLFKDLFNAKTVSDDVAPVAAAATSTSGEPTGEGS